VIANPLIRKVVEVEYALMRTPLAAVGHRLAEGSTARAALDRSVQTLDELIAGLLATPADLRPRAAAADHGDLEHDREQIADAIRAEAPEVGERADPDLDVADVQAELRAKHAVEEREEQRRLTQRATR
jgi:hypothetical protein